MTAAGSRLDGALRYLFSSYERAHHRHRNHFDRDYRDPGVLIELGRERGLLPDPATTCLVTGSKGKGTIARMIAWNLEAAGGKVGLVLTPEETTHIDRIRISNRPLPADDFCRILEALRPRLDALLNAAPPDFYFPPTGLFLLVALAWFHENQTDFCVLEGGRGARHDEIGRLEARVGVVSNILSEHAARLGPSLEQIARDKLALLERCRTLVVGPQVAQWRSLVEARLWDERVLVAGLANSTDSAEGPRPAWLKELDGIARVAAQRLAPGIGWTHFDTPSFFFARGGWEGGGIARSSICLDAAVHPDCLDSNFLQRSGLVNGAVLLGLSRDKDGDGVVSRLLDAGFRHLYVARLRSRVGHLSAWTPGHAAAGAFPDVEVIDGPSPDVAERLCHLAQEHGSVYVVGVQVFIRSVRAALGVTIMEKDVLR